MHEIGSYKPQDLKTEKAYQDLIAKTYDVFNLAVADNDMPNEMRKALQVDAFLFGGLKTHAQLFEASKLLLDANGNLKPFTEVSNQFDKLNVTYNKNYLEAEYEFAVGAAQMAANWSAFSDSDRYYLQYRTAGDDNVRDEHKNLRDTTLPKTDPFWQSYTPPNGWNCRCTVVEVLKDKYPVSNSTDSIAKGEKATTKIGKDGKNRLEIFRFNPGADKKLFPPLHPYGKMKGANVVKKSLKNENLIKSKKEYDNISDNYQKEFFNNKNGGFLVIDKNRIENAKVSKNELAKFLKEKNMATVYANSGIKIKMLEEIPGIKSPDVLADDVLADLKQTSSHNNIMKYAKKANKEQGAEITLFEFTKKTDKINNEIKNLTNIRSKSMYYFTGEEDVIHKTF